jgi:hypothetical protein
MMTARDDYNDAVARAYANRLRVENEAILRKRKDEGDLNTIKAWGVIGFMTFLIVAIVWCAAKTLW